MDASVTLGAGVRVDTTCAMRRRCGGVDSSSASALVGWVNRPKLSSGHLVRRYKN